MSGMMNPMMMVHFSVDVTRPRGILLMIGRNGRNGRNGNDEPHDDGWNGYGRNGNGWIREHTLLDHLTGARMVEQQTGLKGYADIRV